MKIMTRRGTDGVENKKDAFHHNVALNSHAKNEPYCRLQDSQP